MDDDRGTPILGNLHMIVYRSMMFYDLNWSKTWKMFMIQKHRLWDFGVLTCMNIDIYENIHQFCICR